MRRPRARCSASSVSDPAAPIAPLDTNVFVHAQASDRFTGERVAFLAALQSGRVRAMLDPLVLHELSYPLPWFVKQMSRAEVAAYLLTVLSWPGVHGDKTFNGWRRRALGSHARARLRGRLPRGAGRPPRLRHLHQECARPQRPGHPRPGSASRRLTRLGGGAAMNVYPLLASHSYSIRRAVAAATAGPQRRATR